MLEKLAGQLKWEHSDQGIRIDILARWGWGVIFTAILLSCAAIAASQVEWTIPSDDARFRLGLLSAAVIGVAVCCALAWISWSFTGRTFVSVNQNEIKIQRKVLGIEWDTRRFASFEVRELRYSPPR